MAFDFTNGFHDTANAMATSIATGALKPRVAVLISGVLNLVGAFLGRGHLVEPADLACRAAVQLVDALVGGLIEATWVAAGGDAVHFATGGIYALSRRQPVGPNNVADVPASRLQPAGAEVRA